MKIIAKLKVNTYTSREQIILGLTEAGYMINVEEKETSDRYYKSKDHYIIIREPEKE